MVEEKERLLEQYFQSAAIASRRIPEPLLEEAVAAGLNRGKRIRRSRAVMRRSAVFVGTIAAAMLLVIGIAFPQAYSPSRLSGLAAKLMDRAEVPDYVEQLAGERGILREALDDGKYQAIERTASYGGYQVTVDGMLTDLNHVVLFYTSSGAGERITPDSPRLFTLGYDPLNAVQFMAGSQQFKGVTEEGGIYHDMIIFDLPLGETLPSEFYLAGRWRNEGGPVPQDQWLEVKIPVKANRLAVLERVIDVNRTLDFDGQKIKVSTVKQDVQQLEITLLADPSNDKRAERMYGLMLYNNRKGGYTAYNLVTMASNGEGWELGYFAPEYQRGDPLILTGKGLETAFEGEKKMVINTATKTLVQAPDSRLKLESIKRSGSFIRIRTAIKTPLQGMAYVARPKSKFKDANGAFYPLPQDGGVHEAWNSRGEWSEYYFDIPASQYVQPLTFDLRDYPGELILQDFKIEIK
ncbi:hypothetical protein FHS19_004916 [Paenibacillus rhizosphaerae]|uniref:DUF4179 domain-containing protein n=1 Tax=Paenibacillus rhizosphaerae TaxID=297318 RepID=A0A839TUJ7_9BACL|nr:DUF4179 domain-containing protein [Paenibacillus rhizosphaerae]MBB3130211.1 hypothetical protein [Paenibacillus rhizosphaerae]